MAKRLLGWMLILGLPLIGIAAYKTVKESFLSVRVDKSVSFNLYKGNDYASSIYDSTEAEIEITVEKVNGKNRSPVWDPMLCPKPITGLGHNIGSAVVEKIPFS